MEAEIPELPPEVKDALDLGMLLGNNQALGLVASRCSAAQAAGLKRLREEEKYKAVTPRWREFCSQYLRISGAEADRIIRLWNEFGAGYFEASQLTRISPDVYRTIAPSIRDGALHVNGEIIQLNAGNSRRLAAAVAEARQKAQLSKTAQPIEPSERLSLLGRRAAALTAEFEEMALQQRDGPNWVHFAAILSRFSAELRRLELACGMK